ncbi:hypothetical protein MTP99_019411 [Tenebrio molitor]|nr:hypothetical protein MTP99_019411 [Tenebrio molitor]
MKKSDSESERDEDYKRKREEGRESEERINPFRKSKKLERSPVKKAMGEEMKEMLKKISLLSYLVSFEQQNTLSEAIKAFNLKDAVTLSTAWNKVEKETIAKCWKHILSVPDDNSDSQEDMPLNILQQTLKNSIERNITQETIELLEVINPNPTYSTEDIINWNKADVDMYQELIMKWKQMKRKNKMLKLVLQKLSILSIM